MYDTAGVFNVIGIGRQHVPTGLRIRQGRVAQHIPVYIRHRELMA